jgi:hypothetical protein
MIAATAWYPLHGEPQKLAPVDGGRRKSHWGPLVPVFQRKRASGGGGGGDCSVVQCPGRDVKRSG